MSQTADSARALEQVKTDAPANGQASSSMENVYRPIAAELAQVESILKTELRSDTPFVDQLLEHSWLLGGKRIRPVFVLLSAASCGGIQPSHLQLAAALEMIHTATRGHDDFLDEAETRRHRPTANAIWGAKQSVLLGDYLFTHAFHVAALGESAPALRMLAQASNRVCEGEMRQNGWVGEFDLDEASYLRMITEKTAELCGVGCRIGAFLAGASDDVADQYEAYGRNLGVAFQIIDDVLDIVGQTESMGKTLGTDLANQKPTLPVIHCLEKLPTGRRDEFLTLLSSENATAERLLEFLNETDSIGYARLRAREHSQAAIDFAQSLDSNVYSAALGQLADFVLARTN